MASPYNHPKWRALKAQVAVRSKGLCEECKAAKAEHTHHLSYNYGQRGVERLLVPLRHLRDLCHVCHQMAHPDHEITSHAEWIRKKKRQKRLTKHHIEKNRSRAAWKRLESRARKALDKATEKREACWRRDGNRAF